MHEDDRTGPAASTTPVPRPTPRPPAPAAPRSTSGVHVSPGALPTAPSGPATGSVFDVAHGTDTGRTHPTAPDHASAQPPPDGTTSAGDAEESTGDAAVDQALSKLAGLDTLAVREHVAVFEAVHAALQDRLADVED